ncbi:MAG: FAD-dependent oxidoreductase [Clostridia bacterium]|nr:FAD-dependent oxidoreductase [Clostridia bacterium]
MKLSALSDNKPFTEEISSVNFDAEFDVIVCGLGTAGSMAAYVSAKNGLSVLGIENFNCVGGTTTIGGIQSHYFGCPGGEYEKLDQAVTDFQQKHTRNQIESRKYVVENEIIKLGAEILYESSVIGIYLENSKVIGARVITANGIKNFSSKVLMDCTGDGIIAAMCGCSYDFGRESDGLAQPYSMVSSTRNGDYVGWNNRDYGRVDPRDDVAISKALIYSRAYEPPEAFEKCRLIIHMPLIGVREGRLIHCEETVTMQDVLNGKKTSQPMFYSYADFDKHGWDNALDGEILGDWNIGSNLNAYNVTIAVPFLSIVPKSVGGLLVPCRALGVDRYVASCVRMVIDMKKIGEAGAVIAKLAIENNCQLKDIPYNELAKILTESGCLDHSFDRPIRIDGTKNWDQSPLIPRSVEFIKKPEDLPQLLKTDHPGEAIWSAGLIGQRAIPTLTELLKSTDENSRKHSALALGRMGADLGKDILLEMATERDPLMLKDCRKNNQQRGCMAIYWLGRLGAREAVEVLSDIITNKAECERPQFKTDQSVGTWYIVSGFNNRLFQFVLNSTVALIRIGNLHPDLRQKIADAFSKAFDDESYYNALTDRPRETSEGVMILNLKSVTQRAVSAWSNGKPLPL